jgi:hypothetical protein
VPEKGINTQEDHQYWFQASLLWIISIFSTINPLQADFYKLNSLMDHLAANHEYMNSG